MLQASALLSAVALGCTRTGLYRPLKSEDIGFSGLHWYVYLSTSVLSLTYLHLHYNIYLMTMM